MEAIHVGLYGGKGILSGRETPLEASLVFCNEHQNCSYYQNNQCLMVRGIGASDCRFGTSFTDKGYTSKAKKYREFKSKWENHDNYNKLNLPPKKLGLINNFVVFPYSYVRIDEQENGEITLNSPLMFGGDKTAFIHEEKFTIDFIHRLCSFRPQAVMGGEIRDYRDEIVPMFISHLKEVMPGKYKALIDKYPGYAEKIDYIGRKALIKTINPSLVHYKTKRYPKFNEEWYWDGEYLIYKGGYAHRFNITNDYDIEEIKIKPGDKSMIKISSNDQVTSKTLFID
jgi:hypothetical protein